MLRSSFRRLMEGGELFHQIVKLTYFSEELSRHVITQVAQGIRYLHEEKGVVHRFVSFLSALFDSLLALTLASHEIATSSPRTSSSTPSPSSPPRSTRAGLTTRRRRTRASSFPASEEAASAASRLPTLAYPRLCGLRRRPPRAVLSATPPPRLSRTSATARASTCGRSAAFFTPSSVVSPHSTTSRSTFLPRRSLVDTTPSSHRGGMISRLPVRSPVSVSALLAI